MSGSRVLRVFVTDGCPDCRHALALVRRLRWMRPQIRVEVVDMARPDADVPDGVVAAPGFVRGGRVLARGEAGLLALLAELDAAGERRPDTTGMGR
ncbi:hypothetical protein [Nocardiopsis chromatogenes]|uniref:hypothetical protein n=1 Tax=Nocardiopsis chromatogenes TaxID=280239 RepID=UPI001268DF49|nr:hypothetical protein [Nocardiopsis chromatogenes]